MAGAAKPRWQRAGDVGMTVAAATPRQRTVQWVLGSDTLLISDTEYQDLRAERARISQRLRVEVLFDQLATNVIEWHQAIVRFASRLSAAGTFALERATWVRAERECSLMLRVANVLSAAFSFTEAVEQDGPHRRHECGNSICTIARELRNRLQHDVLGSSHHYGPIPTLRNTPGEPKVVGLRVRWRDVRDRIEGRGSEKRRRQFEDACRTEFPELDEIDLFTVINEHLRCLSTVMKDVRQQWPPDDLIAVHKRLAQRGESSQQGEPWSRYVVSPKGKTVHLKLAEDNVDQFRGMMSCTDRLPDLELVQFGEGRPALGPLNERASARSGPARGDDESTGRSVDGLDSPVDSHPQ